MGPRAPGARGNDSGQERVAVSERHPMHSGEVRGGVRSVLRQCGGATWETQEEILITRSGVVTGIHKYFNQIYRTKERKMEKRKKENLMGKKG